MRYIFLFFIVFSFISFSKASSLQEEVKNQYELINISNDQINSYSSYFSNDGNKYVFVGGMEYYPVESKDELSYFEDNGYVNNESLFLNKNGKILLLKKSFINGNSVNCKSIKKNKLKLINSYIDEGVLKVSKSRLIGKNRNACFKYENDFYFTTNSIAKKDINFLEYNSSNIKEKMSTIEESIKEKDKINKLKYLYRFVMENTDYNYEALENGNSQENNNPWSLAYFLNGGKVVCDGYVKALVFLAKYFDISAKRVVGDSQPIDNTNIVLEDFGHSWVRVGNKYFDPTFDDSKGKVSFDYFNKTKKCFNLNHYTTGWQKLETVKERYKYIQNNFSYLINNCSGILNNVVLNDQKIESFIRDLFKEEKFGTIRSYLCNHLGVCDLKSENKKGLVNELSSYKITVGGVEYKFSQILDNINYSNTDTDSETNTDIQKNNSVNENSFSKNKFGLNKEKRQKVKKISQNVISTLKKYSYDKRINKFKEIKKKIKNYINSSNISQGKKRILKYFQSIFVIEKIR